MLQVVSSSEYRVAWRSIRMALLTGCVAAFDPSCWLRMTCCKIMSNPISIPVLYPFTVRVTFSVGQ